MTSYKSPLVYTPQQRRLHWWVAGIVAVQYISQNWLSAAMDRVNSGESVGLPDFLLTNTHVLLGLIVAYLVFQRLRLRRNMNNPGGAEPPEAAQPLLALWVHRGLYAVLIGMVVSGALHYYVGWSFAGQAHELGKWLLGVLIALHLVGVGVHWLRQQP